MQYSIFMTGGTNSNHEGLVAMFSQGEKGGLSFNDSFNDSVCKAAP